MITRHPYPAAVVTLHTPWWQRLLLAWQPRQVPPEARQPQTWHPEDLGTLRGLSDATLRDIGAPEWVHETRRRNDAATLDLLRL